MQWGLGGGAQHASEKNGLNHEHSASDADAEELVGGQASLKNRTASKTASTTTAAGGVGKTQSTGAGGKFQSTAELGYTEAESKTGAASNETLTDGEKAPHENKSADKTAVAKSADAVAKPAAASTSNAAQVETAVPAAINAPVAKKASATTAASAAAAPVTAAVAKKQAASATAAPVVASKVQKNAQQSAATMNGSAVHPEKNIAHSLSATATTTAAASASAATSSKTAATATTKKAKAGNQAQQQQAPQSHLTGAADKKTSNTSAAATTSSADASSAITAAQSKKRKQATASLASAVGNDDPYADVDDHMVHYSYGASHLASQGEHDDDYDDAFEAQALQRDIRDIQEALDQDLDLARFLDEQVRAATFMSLATTIALHTFCS